MCLQGGIPATWADADGLKRHFVGQCVDNGETLIISRRWSGARVQWDYFTEKIATVEYIIGLNKC